MLVPLEAKPSMNNGRRGLHMRLGHELSYERTLRRAPSAALRSSMVVNRISLRLVLNGFTIAFALARALAAGRRARANQERNEPWAIGGSF